MKLTNRHLAIIGAAVGAIGLALEWKNIFGGKTLGTSPLVKRSGTTPATGRPAVSATSSTAGRVSPTGTVTQSGLTLGSTLTPIASILSTLFGGSSNKPATDSSKASGSAGVGFGGGANPSSPGGSAGNVNAGRGAPFSQDNTPNAVGTGPTGSSPYADLDGNVAYPDGDGNYSDEWGNQVWITADGSVTYDQTEDVGYVAGGPVDLTDQGDPLGMDPVSDSGDGFGDPAQESVIDIPQDPSYDSSANYWDAGSPTIDYTAQPDPAVYADDGLSDYGGDFNDGF